MQHDFGNLFGKLLGVYFRPLRKFDRLPIYLGVTSYVTMKMIARAQFPMKFDMQRQRGRANRQALSDRIQGERISQRRAHIAGHPGCLDLLPLAQTFLRSRFRSRGLYRFLLSHHNIDKKKQALCTKAGLPHD